MQTLRLEVNNVKCNGCARVIQSGLSALAGVASVEVDLSRGTVTLTGDPLPNDKIVAALGAMGYPVKAPTN
ncbi:MAG: hypothetical protein AMS22_02430 [Thiotrichales bacterium SG8_50]|nr:MAG: hypothetical protein AMS22_02430 [Thiotrichales bacterium SG8_50]